MRQPGNQQYEIGHGQAEQIVIGRRVHVLVFGDHQTRDGVTDDARHEYHRVHDDHGHDNVQRIPFRQKEGATFDAYVTTVTVQRHHTTVLRKYQQNHRFSKKINIYIFYNKTKHHVPN